MVHTKFYFSVPSRYECNIATRNEACFMDSKNTLKEAGYEVLVRQCPLY